MLKSEHSLISVFVVLLLLSGCSKDDPQDNLPSSNEVPVQDLAVDDLLGTWEADSARIVQLGSPFEEMDILAGGGTGTFIVQKEGFFILALFPIETSGGKIYSGQLFLDAGDLRMLFDESPGDTVMWDIQTSETKLLLDGPATYDFIGDGTLEDAFIDLTLDRSN